MEAEGIHMADAYQDQPAARFHIEATHSRDRSPRGLLSRMVWANQIDDSPSEPPFDLPTEN